MPERDHPPSQRSGRDRLLDALRRPRLRGQLTAAVVLALVGFASVVQVRANQQDEEYEGVRQEDLIQILNSLAAASERAEGEIAELEETRSSLLNDNESREAALAQAREQAAVLGVLAGTVPAVGPGVRVTVEDPARTVGTDQILNGLQELRNAGAEAIEMNDRVRVVAQTALADGEEGIVVDGQRLQPPYVIEAIGEPETLATALEFAGGLVPEIERVGGRVRVEQDSEVEVASTRPPHRSEFAEPVPEDASGG